MIIGAHVSIAGGLKTAVKEAKKLNIQALQIFSSSPRTWKGPVRKQTEIDDFKQQCRRNNLGPVYIHAKYLVNLGSPNRKIINQSIGSLIYDLDFAGRIKAAGVILHIGSFKDTQKNISLNGIIVSCRQILHDTPASARLILENSAGAGRTIGSQFNEIGLLINSLASPRVGFCLDTCHAFASGYDFRTSRTVDNTLAVIDRTISLKKLDCLHLNDSQTSFNSHRDRHANIGEGYLGRNSFRWLVNHPDLLPKPMIIETPNLKTGQGSKDIKTLKSLIKS